MSEEKSSSSSSSTSSSSSIRKNTSKNAFLMKRQSSNNTLGQEAVANQSSSEEAKDDEATDNLCKKRRKSDQDNNDNVVDGGKIENNISDTIIDGEQSGCLSFEQPSGSKDVNSTKFVKGGVTGETKTNSKSELADVKNIVEVPLNNSTAAEVESSQPVNGGSGAEENSQASSSEFTSQRSRRMRRRSYRRYLPDVSSDSASPSPSHPNENGDDNGETDDDIPLSVEVDTEGDQLSDCPFFLPPFDTESQDSDGDLNFLPSSDDDASLEDELAMFEDVEDHNMDSGDGTSDSQVKRNVLKLVDEVLNNRPTVCKWNTTSEVMWRESGITNRFAKNIDSRSTFNNRFYGSQFVVERIKLSNCLRRHNGCVNSLNFNSTGDLLCSGSDDRRIVVWDWAHNKVKHVFPSGHRENIFQTKFITSGTALDIVSAGRDGQVRRSIIPSSGKAVTSCLYKHRNAVHKLVITPNNPFVILSVGEDGCIRQRDLRGVADSAPLATVNSIDFARNKVRLFSISHHPYAPEICVCGSDEYVRIYDTRKLQRQSEQTVRMLCPSHLKTKEKLCTAQVTCCTYNYNGSEILATYSDESIYLFDNTVFDDESYLHRYRGHYNHRTIKGVNFFGPRSEYVISGSDCGHIFFWDKESEAIVNFMSGDDLGVVNCLEPHPSVPVLATSGLDHSVKIWAPGSVPTVPKKEKIKNCLVRNVWRSCLQGRGAFFNLSLNEIIMQSFRADPRFDSDDSVSDGSDGHFGPDTENTSNSSSSSSSPSIDLDRLYYSHSSDNDEPSLNCRTQ